MRVQHLVAVHDDDFDESCDEYDDLDHPVRRVQECSGRCVDHRRVREVGEPMGTEGRRSQFRKVRTLVSDCRRLRHCPREHRARHEGRARLDAATGRVRGVELKWSLWREARCVPDPPGAVHEITRWRWMLAAETGRGLGVGPSAATQHSRVASARCQSALIVYSGVSKGRHRTSWLRSVR
jgi:hypothetical protein